MQVVVVLEIVPTYLGKVLKNFSTQGIWVLVGTSCPYLGSGAHHSSFFLD